jgi:hypothetical protein
MAPFKNASTSHERKSIIQRRMIQTFQFVNTKSMDEQLKKTSIFPKLMAVKAHLSKSYQIVFNRFLNKDAELLVTVPRLNLLEQPSKADGSSPINQTNSLNKLTLI